MSKRPARPKGPSLWERLAARAAERPETAEPASERGLRRQSRRDFLLFGPARPWRPRGRGGSCPTAPRRAAAWRARPPRHARRARRALGPRTRERVLDGALTLRRRRRRGAVLEGPPRAHVRALGRPRRSTTITGAGARARVPAGWSLELSGLASGRTERLTLASLAALGLPPREQVTRLVCVEGWSAVACWGGSAFADLLAAFPPAPGARWAALRSEVNLDARRPAGALLRLDRSRDRAAPADAARHSPRRRATVAGARRAAAPCCADEARAQEHQGGHPDRVSG